MRATIGRGRAVAMISGINLDGLVAWIVWALVHIWSLIEFRNRLAVMLQWTWAYLSRQRSARLITGDGRAPDVENRVTFERTASPDGSGSHVVRATRRST